MKNWEKYEKLIDILASEYKIDGYDKDDIKQELRIKIWQIPDNVINKEKNVKNFVYTCCVNHLHNLARNQKRNNRNFICVGGLDTDIEKFIEKWRKNR